MSDIKIVVTETTVLTYYVSTNGLADLRLPTTVAGLTAFIADDDGDVLASTLDAEPRGYEVTEREVEIEAVRPEPRTR